MFKLNEFLNLNLNEVLQTLYAEFGKPETIYKIPIYGRTSSEVKVFRAKFFKKIELYSGAFQKTLIIYRGFFNNYECRCQYNEKYELVDIIFLKNGNYHRLDGPAYVCINNSNNNMFCINGEKYKDELSYLVKVEQFNRKKINFWEKLI